MTEHEWEKREEDAKRRERRGRVVDYILIGLIGVLAIGMIAVGIWYYW